MNSTDLRAEIAALATVSEDQYEASLTKVLADFDTFVSAQPATADPIATAVVTTKAGVVTNLVPQS